MKNLRLFPIVVLLSLFAVFTACEKDENENNETPTVSEQLVGKWTGDEFYEDGTLSPFNDFFKISYNEFKADGTGTSASPFGEQPLIWSYDETTETLRIETKTVTDENDLTVEGSVYENISILKLDESNLWYTYEDEGVVIEERYKK